MLFHDQVRGEIQRRMGLRLKAADACSSMTIAGNIDRGYWCSLHGPYYDLDAVEPMDTRLFFVYRTIDGTSSLDVLVQDADDDAFLNSNAEGAEKYRDLRATW